MTKWEKRKIDDLARPGKAKVVFEGYPQGRIEATVAGIECTAIQLHDIAELDHFAQQISLAWKEHLVLKPKIQAVASGH